MAYELIYKSNVFWAPSNLFERDLFFLQFFMFFHEHYDNKVHEYSIGHLFSHISLFFAIQFK